MVNHNSRPADAPASTSSAMLTVYATRWCPDCHQARSVLDANGVSYRWIDIEEQPDAVQQVLAINGGYRSVPTIVFPDGQVLVEPTRPQLLEALEAVSLGGGVS
jgi:mycoredoxin